MCSCTYMLSVGVKQQKASEVLNASIKLMTTLNMIISCSCIANCANTDCVHLFHINVECKPYVKQSKFFFPSFLNGQIFSQICQMRISTCVRNVGTELKLSMDDGNEA